MNLNSEIKDMYVFTEEIYRTACILQNIMTKIDKHGTGNKKIQIEVFDCSIYC